MPTFSNTRANVEMVIPHLKEAEIIAEAVHALSVFEI